MKARPSLHISVIALAVLLGTFSGCLKTRAQLKDQTNDHGATPAGTPAPLQDVQPPAAYVVDELKTEITRLSGRIEDLERARKEAEALAASGDAAKEEAKKLENRIVELETAQANMLEVIKKMQETHALQADPSAAFAQGREHLEAGNFDAAVDSFNLYLKSPRAKNAEEATYLRAEAFYSLKQYKKAIIDYSKFPEQYTHSKRMPAALYKIGLSFEALGMKEDAKAFYQDLVEKFPKSPEAKKAVSKVKKGR